MRSLFSSAPQQASAPEQASAPAAAVPPSEHESEAGPEFDAVRLRRLRDFLQETDVENRLASCVEQMLSGEELPWNPYPSLSCSEGGTAAAGAEACSGAEACCGAEENKLRMPPASGAPERCAIGQLSPTRRAQSC